MSSSRSVVRHYAENADFEATFTGVRGTVIMKGWFVLATVLPVMILSWFAGCWVRRWAIEWRFYDEPSQRKDHARPVPLGGGLAIWFAVVAPLLTLQFIANYYPTWLQSQLPDLLAVHVDGLRDSSGSLMLLLSLATIAMLLGFADDCWRIPWPLRLACQFVIAAVAVGGGEWKLTLYVSQPWITSCISVVWIVALVNAFNMMDNMDGLSSGCAAIACTALMAILLWGPNPEAHEPQWFLAGFLGVLLGAILGFLFHNASPARLFMGDAGSYFLGFCVAVVTMQASYASYQPGTWHATLAPLLVMAVPLYDMLSVMLIRWREGRSIFQADRRHLSHRLVARGLTRSYAVATIHLLTATCCLSAILLHRVDNVGAGFIVIIVICVLGVIAMLESGGETAT